MSTKKYSTILLLERLNKGKEMRQIKFRGMTAENKFVYGLLSHDLPNSTEYYSNYSHRICWHRERGGQSNAPVKNGTVGQYTGLQDRNGKDIYEGDIVVVPNEYIWFDEGKPNYRGVVEWLFSAWQVIQYCVNPEKRGISDGINCGLNDDGEDEGANSIWEVIGNIHENPELLKEQK